jgi:hypothetical protein
MPYENVLEAMSLAALAHAIEVRAPISARDWDPARESLVELLERGGSVIDGLYAATNDRGQADRQKGMALWSHREFALNDIKNKSFPYFCRSEAECAVASYLDLPYRVRIIERLLIDVLVAMELFGFADKVLNSGRVYLQVPDYGPFGWFTRRRVANEHSKMLSVMINCYGNLRSDGPISARHIVERLATATNQGVIWPAPVFALLDDVAARRDRL